MAFRRRGRHLTGPSDPPYPDPIATHYELLGIQPTATADEIRSAYRALARRHHPDAVSGGSAVGPGGPSMAELNEAWRVLGEPSRRAVYDASLRPKTAPRVHDDVRYPVQPDAYEGRDGGLPWFWLAMVGVLLGVFILSSQARSNPDPAPTDGLLRTGDCVVIETNLDASEVPCSGPHAGVVDQLVAFDVSCPIDTQEHRDRQGMGKACVRLVEQ
ncbi:MAG: J domain-containing protein [Ilumatobacteraceae bacterium]